MFHGHKQGVQDNTDGDSQVDKGIHYNQINHMLYFQPWSAAIPDQTHVCKFVPAWRTFLSGFLEF